MNKYQKALEVIYGKYFLFPRKYEKSFMMEQFKTIDELVVKATPRKVSKNVFGSWACDACGVSFQEWGQHTYCEHCGQKASWEGTL